MSKQSTSATGRGPKAYLKSRHALVRAALREHHLDGLLITHTPDLFHLTDFTGDDSVGLITDQRFCLLTDFRYKEQASVEAPWCDIQLRDDKMSDLLAKVIADLRLARIGFDAASTTVGQIKGIEKSLRQKKVKARLAAVENLTSSVRKIKDDHEISLIRKAAQVAEEAFEAVRAQIKVGLTENYLAGSLIFELRARGASDASFPPIVATGASSSLPHYRPGEALVRNNQPLLIDWGARYRGYCSDLTRTLLVGRVSRKTEIIYQIVLKAQLEAIRFLRPGVTTKQADGVARDIIKAAGYDDFFGHGLGHGLGVEVHEQPRLRKFGDDEDLQPGMVVTVEPGIYLPGEGGVRIEDDVLITHSGCEVLTSLKKGIEDCRVP